MNIMQITVDMDKLISNFLEQTPEISQYFESVTLLPLDPKNNINNKYLLLNYIAKPVKQNRISMDTFNEFETKFNEYLGSDFIIYLFSNFSEYEAWIAEKYIYANNDVVAHLKFRVMRAKSELYKDFKAVNKFKMKPIEYRSLCLACIELLKSLKDYCSYIGIDILHELDKYMNTLGVYHRYSNTQHKIVLYNIIEYNIPDLLKHI